MSQVVSMRLQEEQLERLRRMARRLGRTVAGAPSVVALHNGAVGNADGEVRMYRNPDTPCLHSYWDPGATAVDCIPAARLDGIMASHLTDGDKVAVVIPVGRGGRLRRVVRQRLRQRPPVGVERRPCLAPQNIRHDQLVDVMLDEDLKAPGISKRARRVITAAFVLNILAVMVLLAVILPAGNKAVLYKVQNLPTPWCRPFGCDRG